MIKKILQGSIVLTSLVTATVTDMQAQSKVPAFDLSSLDKSINPCSDFDNFVNGNWKKNNPIPSTESRWGAFNELDKTNKEVRIKSIILDLSAQKNLKKNSEAQQIADFYNSYLDQATVNNRGIKPLEPYLKKVDQVNSLKDYAKLSGELDPIGISTIFSFGVYADKHNSKMNAVYFGQSGLSLGEKGYYERTDSASVNIRKEFVNYVNKLFKLAGYTKYSGQDVLDFETKLAAISLNNVQLRDPVKTYNKVSFKSLVSQSKNFNQDVFAKGIGIKTDSVIVQNVEYITKANELLKNTPIEVLKAYATFQLLSDFASVLPEDYQQASFYFGSTVMRGVKERKPLQERAIRATDGILGMPLGKLFAEKYFPASSKQKVSEMIENVRAAFGERIDQLSWMSPETKVMAHKKLAAFTYKIGYPDKWKDYSTIDINKDKLFENVVSARIYGNNEAIKKIGQPVDKKEWGMSPQTVNAYYSPLNNEVVFPAGILQPPFYNPDADDAINYGGIIAVIGHEFTHGFDDKGAQYDAEGNLKNWWTEADKKNFDSLAKRYIDYFSNIEPLPGYHINGALTIGENIADLGGLTLAYNALKKSYVGKGFPAPIDGFTWQQRFFLGWAQVWHNNSTEEALRSQISTDPHSPAHDRINVPLTQLVEFQEAWQCPDGSRMTLPQNQRIVIW